MNDHEAEMWQEASAWAKAIAVAAQRKAEKYYRSITCSDGMCGAEDCPRCYPMSTIKLKEAYYES